MNNYLARLKVGQAWVNNDPDLWAILHNLPAYDNSRWRTVRVCSNVTYKRRRAIVRK